MKPLVTCELVLTWFCVYPVDDAQQKTIWKVFSVATVVSLLSGWVGSAIYFGKYFSVDLEACLYAMFQISAVSSGLYMYIISFYTRHKIKAFFEHLSDIYDESNNHF